MKRIILFTALAVNILACGPSKTVTDSYKVMKGYWTLTDITYDRSGRFNITLFDEASANCFEGSSWRFIPNNNTGRYTIEGAGCSSGERHFIFTVQEIDKETGLYDFMLKPTNAKGKSDDNRGIRLRLAQLDDQTMRWQQTVSVEGQPFTISMNFIKNE
jgi:hypothetical protein